ncbi:MAG TPA: ribonuclease H-like domain-containing protein [Roseiflexaceae bacterium]|nr:ribonuclease H-like domain-containing protein [Roseiflexaceae bacterium]
MEEIRAYLDIETTFEQSISLIGIYRRDIGTIQLIGGGISDLALYRALEGVQTLVTFNGSGFDLPVIRKRLYVDLRQDYAHCDLMYVCRRHGLRAGLEKIEERIGIWRSTAGISGWDAPRLWHRYEMTGDRTALRTLLDYNREDVINLARLEEHLGLTLLSEICEHVELVS